MLSSAHLQDAPPHLSRTLTQDEEQTSLRQSSSCDPSPASDSELLSASTESRIPHSKILQGKKGLRIVSPESPAKLHCYYAVITVLTVAVVSLSVALSVKKTAQISAVNTYASCPGNWIGVGNKCFYFNETPRNWTLSHTLCKEQEAELARFDNQQELRKLWSGEIPGSSETETHAFSAFCVSRQNFLRRYKGSFDYWIGLHRESSAHPWKWTDNTEYNNSVPIRGDGLCGFLSDQLNISSSRDYINRKWICSKPKSYTSQSQ